jgi:hypothetical protein
MLSAAAEHGPWAFGWEALVAICTGFLALATALLAASTRNVAQETRDELRAQWRPALLPNARDGDLSRSLTDEWDLAVRADFVSARIRNAGRGPALYVRASLDPGGISPSLWSLGAMAPGDVALLQFHGAPDSPRYQVLLDYRDLGGHQYSTAIVIESVITNGQPIWRFYDVRLFDGETVTGLGDALPQDGLRPLPAERA